MSNLNEEALAPVNISVTKRKRSLPGHPDPDAEVIALSPRSLLATNRFICEICNKGFQRDQNLQLHRRGHNLPWRLKQKENHEIRKKVYICPELNCVHHDPARALGDLTGIKKHFSRKHGEKKWKCDKCSKRYAVQSDCKAHQKTCGTREYRCDCGILFSRRDSFITHQAFCNVLDVENSNPPAAGKEGDIEKLDISVEDSAHDATFGEDCSVPQDAASSPPVSQLTGDALISSDPPKPVVARRAYNPAIPEDRIASLSSSWVQGGIAASNGVQSKGPGLSLCLGMDPGLGPTDAPQELVSHTTSKPPSLNKPVFSQIPSLESRNTSKHVPSMGAMGMLANLFSSSTHGLSRGDTSDVAQVSDYSLSVNEYDPSALSSHGMLSAGFSTTMMNDSRNAVGPSKSASMSATALLQKAAQMGAKASTPSLLQKSGMGVRDSGHFMTPQGMQIETSWASFSNSVSNIIPTHSNMRQAERCGSAGMSDVGAAHFPSTLGQGSIQESMGPLVGGARSSGDILQDMLFIDGTSNHGKSSVMSMDKEQSSTLHGWSNFGETVDRPQPPCGGPQRREGERKMLDFLGVGSANVVMTVGKSAGIGQILSHRDLTSITTLTAGTKMEKNLSHWGSKMG